MIPNPQVNIPHHLTEQLSLFNLVGGLTILGTGRLLVQQVITFRCGCKPHFTYCGIAFRSLCGCKGTEQSLPLLQKKKGNSIKSPPARIWTRCVLFMEGALSEMSSPYYFQSLLNKVTWTKQAHLIPRSHYLLIRISSSLSFIPIVIPSPAHFQNASWKLAFQVNLSQVYIQVLENIPSSFSYIWEYCHSSHKPFQHKLVDWTSCKIGEYKAIVLLCTGTQPLTNQSALFSVEVC